jgi:DNA repair exonuclease SbcCD ATPase subunit
MINPVTGQAVPILCIHTNCLKFEFCRLKFTAYCNNCEHLLKAHREFNNAGQSEKTPTDNIMQRTTNKRLLPQPEYIKDRGGVPLRIKLLKLTNFKGRSLTIYADGKDVSVFGDNGTGKTTIFDAYSWLIFGKDSLNQTPGAKGGFYIKPITPDGEEEHGIDSEVEAIFEHDGQEIQLKKVYREVWTKTRGSAEKVFSGNTTDHYFNLIPVSESEYKNRLKEIADEEVFKLLSNPIYFNEILSWQKRREILLKVCGDVSTDDVLQANDSLQSLKAILASRTVDDHKKYLAEKRKKINDGIEDIPVRIDEVKKGIPDISGIDFDSIQKEAEELRSSQDALRADLSSLNNGAAIAEKQKRIAEIDTEISKIKTSQEDKKREAIKAKRDKWFELQNIGKEKVAELSKNEIEIGATELHITTGEEVLEDLRKRWGEINSMEFSAPQQDSVCPTCGQAISQEQLDAVKDAALKAFNLDKAKKLEENVDTGRAKKAVIDEEKVKLTALKKEHETLQKSLDDIKWQIDNVDEEIKGIQAEFEDVTTLPEYQEKIKEKDRISKEIEDIKAGSKEEEEKIQNEISVTEQQIRDLQETLSKKSQVETAEARINDLKAEERKLAAELEGLEHELFLVDEYIKTHVNLVESKINNKFKMARFKLFEQQQNGGVNPVCECMYNGIPYSSMNHAARLNTGLDIINTLSEYYNLFKAPVFLDNAESSTKFVDVDTQVIKLYVSEPDKTLRMEVNK